ncbi:M16 family metallopeptidase [Candidatus Omnitrophota bacterium]
MKNRASVKEEEKGNKTIANHGELNLKFRSLWFIFLIGLFCCLAIFPAQAEQKNQSFSQGEVSRTKLDNGMVVLFKENPDSAIVDFFLCLRSGSAQEGPALGSGAAHFLEHMLFKGTLTRPAGQVFKEIESSGGRINASTGYDYTGYTITAPAESADLALEILADMIINSTLPIEELEKERAVVLKEIHLSADNPQKYLSRLLWQTAYTQHPYKYPILGEEELFAKLSRDQLLNFYHKNYRPENIVLAVVGDIATDQLLAKTKQIFEDFSPGPGGLTGASTTEPQQHSLRQQVREFTSGETYLLLGFHSVALTDQDLFALDLLSAILGEGDSSRLYKTICAEKGWAYSISAVNYTPRDPGLFIISCFLEEKLRQRVLAEILNQVELTKKQKVSPEELAAAKNKLVSQILFSYQTQQAQARDLALNEVYTNDFRFTEKYIQGIEQVSADDIIRVANLYLKQNNLNIAALTPKTGSSSLSLDKKRPPAALSFGVEHLTKDSPQTSTQVTKQILNNGLTLLVKEDHRLPLVSIKAVFQGGLRAEEKTLNGVSNLTAQMLDKGTKAHTAAEIAEFIESKGAEISYFSGNNSFGLALNSLSKDLDPLLELLADLIINSNFPRREFNREKEKNLAELNSLADNIFEIGNKHLKSSLYQEHPYGLLTVGSETSLKKLSRRQVLNFYQKFCVNENLVLAIFGDVDANILPQRVDQLFSKLKTGRHPVIAPAKESDKKQPQIVTKHLSKQQSLLLTGFPGATVFDSDRYALELISALLSQSSGRLFSSIREQAGLAYTLGAYSVVGLDPGYLAVYVATTPENTEAVKEKVLQQLSILKNGLIEDHELKQAKKRLVAEKVISRQTLSSCALESALDELYGLGHNNYLNYAEQINRLTAEDIKRCANRFFNFNNYALVIINPGKMKD